jgi:hypothetical protein
VFPQTARQNRAFHSKRRRPRFAPWPRCRERTCWKSSRTEENRPKARTGLVCNGSVVEYHSHLPAERSLSASKTSSPLVGQLDGTSKCLSSESAPGLRNAPVQTFILKRTVSARLACLPCAAVAAVVSLASPEAWPRDASRAPTASCRGSSYSSLRKTSEPRG